MPKTSTLSATTVLIACALLPCLGFGAQQVQPTEPITLSIADAVQTALARNTGVQAARTRTSEAKARIGQAKAALLPQIQAGADYRTTNAIPSFTLPSSQPGGTPTALTIGASSLVVATIGVRQDIYTGGRTRGQVSRAEALYDVSLAQLGLSESQVAYQTRQTYYNVLLGEAQVVSAQKTLDSACAQLTDAQSRFQAGTSPRFDVLRAETQVSQAQQSLTEARNQAQLARVALNRILGFPQERVVNVTDPGLAPSVAESVDALITRAQRQRPEVLAGNAQIAAAEYGIRVARSGYLPTLAVSANYQKVAPETAVQTSGWTADAVVSLPIFNGGLTKSQVSEARSLRDEARINLADTTESVEQDVRQALLNLQTARQTIDTARTLLAQAEEAYSVATVRYQAGVGTAVEIADALATLTSARTNLNRAIFNYNTAYANLRRSTGQTTY